MHTCMRIHTLLQLQSPTFLLLHLLHLHQPSHLCPTQTLLHIVILHLLAHVYQCLLCQIKWPWLNIYTSPNPLCSLVTSIPKWCGILSCVVWISLEKRMWRKRIKSAKSWVYSMTFTFSQIGGDCTRILALSFFFMAELHSNYLDPDWVPVIHCCILSTAMKPNESFWDWFSSVQSKTLERKLTGIRKLHLFHSSISGDGPMACLSMQVDQIQ